MKISRVDHHTAPQARGIVIVIDVVRVFSVAGYACAGGARMLWLVRTKEEALALQTREPAALLGGEIGGRLIPGFDFNNSPSQMATRDVQGKLLIQRTGAGTQGAVAVKQASSVLLCALTNALATATYARQLATATGEEITLLPTASFTDVRPWDEDSICADYLTALLNEPAAAADILARGIAHLHATERFADWYKGDIDLPAADVEAVLDVNRFNFALVGTHKQWQGITYVEAQRVDVASEN
jgi:2-phosphosulfolactate phosphatase